MQVSPEAGFYAKYIAGEAEEIAESGQAGAVLGTD
jgi:hypothetical protein